jgi:hypothetical protein
MDLVSMERIWRSPDDTKIASRPGASFVEVPLKMCAMRGINSWIDWRPRRAALGRHNIYECYEYLRNYYLG